MLSWLKGWWRYILLLPVISLEQNYEVLQRSLPFLMLSPLQMPGNP